MSFVNDLDLSPLDLNFELPVIHTILNISTDCKLCMTLHSKSYKPLHDRQTDRQTQTDTDRRTDRHTDRHTDRQTLTVGPSEWHSAW